MTKRFSKVVDLPSAHEWGAVRGGVERGDAFMPDISVVGGTPDGGRALRIKAYDRLAATLGLDVSQLGTAGVVVLMHALRMCQTPEAADARPLRRGCEFYRLDVDTEAADLTTTLLLLVFV